MSPLTSDLSRSVSALGEEKLIAAIRRWLGSTSPRTPFGIGDDCAVLPASRGRQLITVDPVIYGRHFDDTVPPRDVAAKLLKRNLSDLAAMGGRPTVAVLALTLDARTDLTWLEQFYRGLAACARSYRVSIVGGDIAQAEGIVAASLTLLGKPVGQRILTRTGAQVGDAIYVTGQLGNSRSSKHHYRFIPRLAEGAWLARSLAVRSMMDLSDGLAKDLHVLTPPRTKPALVAAALPLRLGADLRAALNDGEDYELVFSVSAKTNSAAFEQKWKRAFPRTKLTRIGHFSAANKFPADALRLESFHGYEHLSDQR